jgi:hypothetical protein
VGGNRVDGRQATDDGRAALSTSTKSGAVGGGTAAHGREGPTTAVRLRTRPGSPSIDNGGRHPLSLVSTSPAGTSRACRRHARIAIILLASACSACSAGFSPADAARHSPAIAAHCLSVRLPCYLLTMPSARPQPIRDIQAVDIDKCWQTLAQTAFDDCTHLNQHDHHDRPEKGPCPPRHRPRSLAA